LLREEKLVGIVLWNLLLFKYKNTKFDNNPIELEIVPMILNKKNYIIKILHIITIWLIPVNKLLFTISWVSSSNLFIDEEIVPLNLLFGAVKIVNFVKV